MIGGLLSALGAVQLVAIIIAGGRILNLVASLGMLVVGALQLAIAVLQTRRRRIGDANLDLLLVKVVSWVAALG